MDLGKIAQDTLGQMMNDGAAKSKTTKKKSAASTSPLDGVVDSVDTAVKSKLPKGVVTDLAENALDQNKDGHIVDDLLRMGEDLLRKKK